MNTNTYWQDLFERTARTFAQGFLAVVTLDAFTSFDATWLQTVEGGGLAGAYAILTAFVARGIGNPTNASFRSDA